MIKRICPICLTNEFVNYIMGTHAEGRPIIIDEKEQYVQGDCQAHEHYECDKCGGEFSVQYKIENGKTEHLKIEYSGTRADKSGYRTWA